MSELQAKTIVITGGGTGIGAACALDAARKGAAVTICGRREEALAATVGAAQTEGLSIRSLTTDVTDEDAVRHLLVSTYEETGRLDGVVANAGGGGPLAPLQLQDVGEFERVLSLNVVGTMLLIKHAAGLLRASGGGSFVGMSSLAGSTTHPYFGAYTVAKAGIDHLIRNAADEFGAHKIRFNSIRPGFITTEIMQGIQPGSPIYASYIDNTPMAGVGEPDDVAKLCSFLLSNDARWITGQSIAVDGGNELRRGPDYGVAVRGRFSAEELLED
jgi:NAD(P)-dependent dehydrogenase (short-subunit alcohol dehydrogenase family)